MNLKDTIIAVDFDGTVVTHEFPKIGAEIGAPRVLQRMVKAGAKIILWTMRSPGDANPGILDDAIAWFARHQIPLFGVNSNPGQHWSTSPKAYAHLYIDDAAFGAPLIHNPNLCDRPYIDWLTVEERLFPAIPSETRSNTSDGIPPTLTGIGIVPHRLRCASLDEHDTAILTALAQFGACTLKELAAITEYPCATGLLNASLSSLRDRGLISHQFLISITLAGQRALGDYTPYPTKTPS